MVLYVRIKYEKGFTPERIAEHLAWFIRKNKLTIGSVNVYLQLYDDNMKPIKNSNDEYFSVSPGDSSKREYVDDVASKRRSRLKVV